jgi:antitoxin PrlF
MSTTTLTSKGQITLSKAIRDRLALKQGDRFEMSVTRDGTVTLKHEAPPSVDRAYGMLHRLARPKPPSVAQMRTAVRLRASRKGTRHAE